MSDETKKAEEAEMNDYQKMQAEAKELGIPATGSKEALAKAIAEKKEAKGPTGITASEARSIDAKLKYEAEARERITNERQLRTDIAEITAESESLCIPIDLPENPTELDLARARRTLGVKKREVKPSPETLGIEASKRGYYKFTNREQEDASHTVNLGGKYVIHLIADQIHVLSEYHIKTWRKRAVVPEYTRVQTGVAPGPETTGQAVEKSVRTAGKPRFIFELLGEAPQEAEFGLVTDPDILKELEL